MMRLGQDMADNQKTSGRRKIGPLLLSGCMILIVAVAAVLLTNRFTLELELQGEQEITVEWGTEFSDPGAQASFFGSLILTEPEQIAVKKQGNVDPAKLGTYELEYFAEKQLDLFFTKLEFRQSAKRKVRVVDTVAPEITLLTNPDYFTLPGHNYIEEGYTASDNHDGDLTESVQIQIQNDQIYYQVTDASGNTGEAIRPIVYSDPIAPQVLLE